MTQQEEQWFDKLTEKRKKASETFADPEFCELWDRIIDMYKESAHFVYELIQNADDTLATEAHFSLYKDKLIFKHNGQKRFSISNPELVKEDKRNGHYGDINSITAIASSTKKENESLGNSIGKFGIGFKSVYTYTETPEIYDQTMCFRIEQKIIPIRLKKYCDNWKENETWFIFPFNNPNKAPNIAVSEISKQLSELHNPTLFLNNLQKISYQYEKEGKTIKGAYQKVIEKTKNFPNTKADLLSLIHDVNDSRTEEKLWTFSRKKDNLTYSVGFSIKDDKLEPKSDYAYCYFQTKEETHLNFIIHAPFLLTPDRQHLKDGDEHNTQMILLLAELAADSMVYLRDIGKETGHNLISDDILKIVPIKSDDFYIQKQQYNYYLRKYETIIIGQKTFEPFYNQILNKFKSEKILPSIEGYTSADKAFWAEDTDLINLFPDKNLSKIVNKEEAHWIFRSLRRAGVSDERREWIDKIISPEHCLNENYFLQHISASFCEEKFQNDFNWVISFYEWLDSAKERSNIAKKQPFFIDSEGKSVCLFKNEILNIFFPTEGICNYHTINKKLFENQSARNFLEKLGVTIPSLKDEIYTKILPRYETGMPDDETIKADFKKILAYYEKCPNAETKEFIERIQNNLLLRCKSPTGTYTNAKAGNIYFPKEELQIWFDAKNDVNFIDLDFYKEFTTEDKLILFFEKIGVRSIIQNTYEIAEEYESKTSWDVNFRPICKWLKNEDRKNKEPFILAYVFHSLEGLKEATEHINEKKSKILFRYLCDNFDSLSPEIFIYRYSKVYRKFLQGEMRFNPIVQFLKETPWLYSKSGDIRNVHTIYLEDLADFYELSSIKDTRILKILDIKERPKFDINILDNETRNNLNFIEKLKSSGVSITEQTIADFLEFQKNRQKLNPPQNPSLNEKKSQGTSSQSPNSTSEDSVDSSTENQNANTHHTETPEEKIVKETIKRAKEIKNEPEHTIEIYDTDFEDSDEFTPPSYDSRKLVKKVQDKFAIELNRIKELEDAIDKSKTTKYSYQWFQAMLQLEILRSNENYANSKEVHISFGKVDKDQTATKTLILSKPDKKIPAFMEELYGINVIIHFKGDSQDKQLTFEAASIRSFTLRLKMMHKADIDNLDIENISSAEIIAKSPIFLLDELKKEFDKLNFDKEKNLKFELCDNIKFIFGPPGTGKTTYLANEILLPWIFDKNIEKCNVLVLAPTNKAADVLTKRIMGNNETAQDFLSRFGTTNNDEIENSDVFCSRNLDINVRSKNIVVTTMARLPYDSCVVDGKEKELLRTIKWDYIVIDEASMIPLIYMVYLLYSQQPKQFVIAGDPFQIEPTVSEESWKRENIYQMVGLNDFVNPTTEPHPYEIIKLDTQYRSIPAIGFIYSQLTYGGILKHNRLDESLKKISIEALDILPLNIVSFPVERYESIYRSKKLGKGSNYQIYSAIFTYEFICHIAKSIAQKNSETKCSIGIISPYKAQSDLIGNLLRRTKLPQNISVLSGTVHSFQGDECDIMITVFNTPENISSSDKMFLNHKNIINVAISRARDYLFVLMPDEKTVGIDKLTIIPKLAELMQDSNCRNFESHELEKWMFDNENFLEENTFSTGHQSVNVYSEPEKRYEVRSEDDAIDIQIFNIV
ncbi:ATP-binding protein [uncultured Fibrobacter sp.]|uniref:DEAD/DEAH box helicase n=1 Tax=uncultured Fibrobacter sp. TaxID=261512 RepID=UPI0025F7A596|nr:DEAD/DEAH box helicase [uncultured Fibrobacter sp.]